MSHEFACVREGHYHPNVDFIFKESSAQGNLLLNSYLTRTWCKIKLIKYFIPLNSFTFVTSRDVDIEQTVDFNCISVVLVPNTASEWD